MDFEGLGPGGWKGGRLLFLELEKASCVFLHFQEVVLRPLGQSSCSTALAGSLCSVPPSHSSMCAVAFTLGVSR